MTRKSETESAKMRDAISNFVVQLLDAVSRHYFGEKEDGAPSTTLKILSALAGVLSFINIAISLGKYQFYGDYQTPVAYSLLPVQLLFCLVLAIVIGYGRGLLRFFIMGFFVNSLLFVSVGWMDKP